MKYSLLLSFFLMFTRCETSGPWNLSGEVNVSPPIYMDLFQVKTGRKVLYDTIKSLNFALRVENFEKGIYQIILSWDRDIVRPQEKEIFARQPELGTPKYYMSTTFCWIQKSPIIINCYLIASITKSNYKNCCWLRMEANQLKWRSYPMEKTINSIMNT